MSSGTVAKDFLAPCAIAAVGALGATDPLALLAWLSISAAAAGAICGAAQVRHLALAALPPAVWMGIAAVVDGLSMRDLPSPVWAALAWSGLYAAGFGIGRPARGSPWTAAGALFLLASLLAVLPILPGTLGAPLPPPVEARLLDLSPTTLVVECAGVDWMRHPAIYDAAGSADIDPSLRLPYRGALAGPIAFVVGCLLAAAGEGLARARSKAGTDAKSETSAWHSTNTSAPSPRT